MRPSSSSASWAASKAPLAKRGDPPPGSCGGLCLYTPYGPLEKGSQGQARPGWSRWDTRMNKMENYKLQGCAKLESTLSPVFGVLGNRDSGQ